MTDNTNTNTITLTVRESYNLKLNEAKEAVSSAMAKVTETAITGDANATDSAITTFNEAKANLVNVETEGEGIAEAEGREKENTAVSAAIVAACKRLKIDAFDFSFKAEDSAINRKSKATRTGGNIGKRSTVTFTVNGGSPMTVKEFVSENVDWVIDNPTSTKEGYTTNNPESQKAEKAANNYGNNRGHVRFYSSIVARLRKAGNIVIIEEGDHPAEFHKNFNEMLDHHTKRFAEVPATS